MSINSSQTRESVSVGKILSTYNYFASEKWIKEDVWKVYFSYINCKLLEKFIIVPVSSIGLFYETCKL